MHELVSKALFLSQTEHISAKLAQSRGWILHQMEYPIIDVTFTAKSRTPLRLHAMCEDWNIEPPRFKLLAADGSTLKVSPPPPEISPNQTNVFNANAHPITGEVFICMRGSREYHTHSGHINDHWDAYRHQSGYDLGGLLTQIWHAWLKGTG